MSEAISFQRLIFISVIAISVGQVQSFVVKGTVHRHAITRPSATQVAGQLRCITTHHVHCRCAVVLMDFVVRTLDALEEGITKVENSGTTSDFCGDTTVTRPSCSGTSSDARTIGYYEGWSLERSCQSRIFTFQILMTPIRNGF